MCIYGHCHAIDIEREEVKSFITKIANKYAFNESWVRSILKNAESKKSIIDAISRPAEKTKKWHEYRDIFLTEKRIKSGVQFWIDHQEILKQIENQTGVPIEIIVGIIGVETYFGKITGNYRVIDALSTLAFDYPPRSSFFSKELEQFLVLSKEENIDPTFPTGSYAGAMGRPQFMPSSFRAYAIDASKDGKTDIWTNWNDVIGSVANYLSKHGWIRNQQIITSARLGDKWNNKIPKNTLTPKDSIKSLYEKGVIFSTTLNNNEKSQLLTLEGLSEKEFWVGFHNFFVITRYNRSVMYALAVYQLGQEISIGVQSVDL